MNLAELLTGGNITVSSIIWSIIIGAFIAVIITHINKKTVGRLVKKLLDAKADSPESAKTLSELGLGKKKYLSYALRPSSTLSSIIKTKETDVGKKHYIPEDKAYRAETVFSPKGSSASVILVAAALFIAAGIGLVYLVPHIFSLTGGLF